MRPKPLRDGQKCNKPQIYRHGLFEARWQRRTLGLGPLVEDGKYSYVNAHVPHVAGRSGLYQKLPKSHINGVTSIRPSKKLKLLGNGFCLWRGKLKSLQFPSRRLQMIPWYGRSPRSSLRRVGLVLGENTYDKGARRRHGNEVEGNRSEDGA